MKIKQDNYLGLRFNDYKRTKIYELQKANIYSNDIPEEDKIRFADDIARLLSDDGNQLYLMSQPSLAIAQKIRVSEEKFDGKMFKGLPVGKKITILIDNRLFYRYFITEESIFCCWVTVDPKEVGFDIVPYLQYTTFRINTVKGHLSYPVENPFEVELFERFIQYLVFLEFSVLETVTLKPQGKTHKTKKEGKCFNDTTQNIVIVDSSWNRIIKVGEFGVSGHLRWQPCGANRERRKLIYIDDFIKTGYTRNAKKETVNN